MKVEVSLEYNSVKYKFVEDFKNIPIESILFMFEEGNYACDCNKSIFIKQHCDNEFNVMKCGGYIKLLSISDVICSK